METREVESFGRPAGIKIPLTSCSGATCCHSSSSSLLYFFSPAPPLLLQPSSFISIPPTAFCLLITVSFQAIAGSPHPPPSPLLHLLPFPLCQFFFSFSAYVATSVFTLRARRNLPPNCFHHEYFMISGPISQRRHVVLSCTRLPPPPVSAPPPSLSFNSV